MAQLKKPTPTPSAQNIGFEVDECFLNKYVRIYIQQYIHFLFCILLRKNNFLFCIYQEY